MIGGAAGRVVVLASGSASRRRLLEASGVPFEAEPSGVDEEEYKRSFDAEGASPAELAEVLAEAKALRVSARRPGLLVLGADQVLRLGSRRVDKPGSRDEALAQLKLLRGRSHELISAAVIAEDGRRTWHAVDRATLEMRSASDGFLEAYLDAVGADALAGPGAYRVEALGGQLFIRVEGSHFTVMGLPLLPLLEHLRVRGVLAE